MSDRSSFDFNLFRALEVFAAVVETRNMSRGAEMLGMTQPAASQSLKKLETALGAELIDRGQRPIGLTNAGIVLHRQALKVLGEVDQLGSPSSRAGKFRNWRSSSRCSCSMPARLARARLMRRTTLSYRVSASAFRGSGMRGATVEWRPRPGRKIWTRSASASTGPSVRS